MKRILVVRNDKIGDFMLAWPSFAMPQALHGVSCDCPGSPYTAPLARLCPGSTDHPGSGCPGRQGTATRPAGAYPKAAAFDASICLFSNTRNAKLVWKAHIPTGWHQPPSWPRCSATSAWCSAAPLPEAGYEYNLDLVRRFLADQHQTVVEPQGPYLGFDPESLLQVREQVAARLRLDASRPG